MAAHQVRRTWSSAKILAHMKTSVVRRSLLVVRSSLRM